MTTAWVSELMVRFENDEPVGGWMVAYNRLHQGSEDQDISHRKDWNDTIDQTLKIVGAGLWRPLREWLADLYPPNQNRDEPRPLILLPGLGLNVLPLHAAWWEEDGEQHWACDDYQISYAPSIWVLDRCLRRQAAISSRPDHMLAVRNPTGDLSWAEWEVDSACSMLTSHDILGNRNDDRPATCANLKDELPRSPLALLATHGTYDILDPWSRTGLCTADGDRTDPGQPFFALRDLFELDLSSLWLVVLSSCESALSDYRDPAGEQLGLPAAFLASGATTAVGSLWVVDDHATALLSRRFFEELFGSRSDATTTKANALWRAQRWLRQLTIEEVERMFEMLPASHFKRAQRSLRAARDMTRIPQVAGDLRQNQHLFAHPCYWSAFVCVGAT